MINEPDHKAFEDQKLDDFMRQSLNGYRVNPNPGLWKGISRKLLWREILRLNFKNLSTRGWLTGASAVVLLGTALYLFIPENGVSYHNSEMNTPGSVKESPAGTLALVPEKGTNAKVNISPVSNHQVTTNVPGKNQSVTTGGNSNNRPTALLSYAEENTAKSVSPSPVPLLHTPDPVDIQPRTTATEIQEAGAEQRSSGAVLVRLESHLDALLPIDPANDTIITLMTYAGPVKIRDMKSGSDQFFTASFGVLPERTFYAAPDAYSKMNYWVNGAFTYHLSRFSLSTGLSLGYVFDEGKYRTEFRSLDSVGYYTSVVSFTVGQNNQLIYNTTTQNIYDSLDHSGDYRTQNRFTYLQLPIMAGYRFLDTRRMSMLFEAGPAVSFLVASHYADPVVDYKNARIIRMDEETPARTSVNWQLWARLTMSYRISRQFSFYLEPVGKFFLKPMIDPEGQTKNDPWSLGLGFGIQYHFGNKAIKP